MPSKIEASLREDFSIIVSLVRPVDLLGHRLSEQRAAGIYRDISFWRGKSKGWGILWGGSNDADALRDAHRFKSYIAADDAMFRMKQPGSLTYLRMDFMVADALVSNARIVPMQRCFLAPDRLDYHYILGLFYDMQHERSVSRETDNSDQSNITA